jgi:hypothetical protein
VVTLLLAVPFALLRHYASPFVQWSVLAMCGVAWSLSLAMVALAPLDLAAVRSAVLG